jgi:aldehyde dehydrogenase (NAD+)
MRVRPPSGARRSPSLTAMAGSLTPHQSDGTTAEPPAGWAYDVVAARRATFDSGRTRPLDWRRAQLEGLLRMLDEREAELIAALREDLRKPAIEGFGADIGATAAEIRYTLRHLRRWMRPRRVVPGIAAQPGMGRIVPEPLGVGLIIAPWNYPVQLVLLPLASALAAGNAAVVKPSELAPATSAALARLLPRHVDPDAVAVVEGGVEETTALLAQRFDHIFFTGSTAVGRIVMQAAARHLTPVVLELGGKSPTIVCADADVEVAARRIAWGKHLNAGQTCIAPDYVLVEEPVRDQLVEALTDATRSFVGADPAASPDLARIVNERHAERLAGLLRSAGGTVACGGTTDVPGRYVEPTVVVDPDPEAPIMHEEIFGPILPVVGVSSVTDAIEQVRARPKPLALYVFSDSPETVDRVLEGTTSGGVCVNHTLFHQAATGLPFGGVGASGMGAYHGRAGFDAYSHHRSVLTKPVRPELKLLYPPYSRLKSRLIRSAL